jgi:hypothetical protein
METEKNIFFASKEENNQRRLKEALARTPHERVIFFLKLCEEMQVFQSDYIHPNRVKNNFVVE